MMQENILAANGLKHGIAIMAHLEVTRCECRIFQVRAGSLLIKMEKALKIHRAGNAEDEGFIQLKRGNEPFDDF